MLDLKWHYQLLIHNERILQYSTNYIAKYNPVCKKLWIDSYDDYILIPGYKTTFHKKYLDKIFFLEDRFMSLSKKAEQASSLFELEMNKLLSKYDIVILNNNTIFTFNKNFNTYTFTYSFDEEKIKNLINNKNYISFDEKHELSVLHKRMVLLYKRKELYGLILDYCLKNKIEQYSEFYKSISLMSKDKHYMKYMDSVYELQLKHMKCLYGIVPRQSDGYLEIKKISWSTDNKQFSIKIEENV